MRKIKMHNIKILKNRRETFTTFNNVKLKHKKQHNCSTITVNTFKSI